MKEINSFLEAVAGIGDNELSTIHILSRCILIYIIGIILVRLGNKRFVGKMSAFDIILAIIIGSLLSRAVTETGLFLPILGACLLLILIHRSFSYITSRVENIGSLIKGHERIIVKDGEILWDQLRKCNLSEQDLMQTVRLNANTGRVEKVKTARMERNGDISVILKEDN